MKISKLACPLAAALLLASCAAQEKANQSPSSAAESDGERATAISSGDEAGLDDDAKVVAAKPQPSGLETLVTGNKAFAFDLHRALPTKNLAYSPHSISRTLAPVFAGAAGNTAAQMQTVLHYNADEGQLHQKFGRLDLELQRREDSDTPNQTAFRLKSTNHIWAAPDFSFSTQYLKIVENDYRTTPTKLDFRSSAGKALDTINKTIGDATAGRIPKLLSPQNITADTRLVITNAVYFNAPWATPFPKASTQTKDFRVSPTSKVPVPMMLNTGEFKYAKESNYELLELPYLGDQVSALIVLPNAGAFEDVDRSLSPSRLEWLLGRMVTQRVEVQLPRFKVESKIDIKEVLNTMGIVDAFDASKADFAPMVSAPGKERIYVSDVVHQTFLSVDEAGTEAAAATAAVMSRTGMPMPPKAKFVADRPFTFLILDRPTGEVLFIARIMQPKGS